MKLIREEVQDEWPDKLISDKITNDVFSLGDLTIWNEAYLCLVTETVFKLHDPDNFFISEKTWKPIMGLRPYFLNSNKGIIEILENLEIYTPAMLFENNKLNDCSITEIVNQLKLIDDPIELYQKQLVML